MKKFFTTRPLMKLLSLALSFLLWLSVHGEQRIEINVKSDVQIKNKPSDLIISGDIEPIIQLRIAGPRSRVNLLADRDLDPYILDLKDTKPGAMTFRIYDEDFKLPHGTTITRISPQGIRVKLDVAEERLVRIRPRFLGELEEGFDLVAYEILPPYLKIKGARSDLAALSTIETEPIALPGRRDSFEDDVRVRLPANLADNHETHVSVRATIRERNISKIVEDIPIHVGGMDGKVQIEPETVTLKIEGPAGEVATAIGERLEIEIDGTTLGLNQKTKKSLRIRPHPPRRPGIEITMIPDNVLVKLAQD